MEDPGRIEATDERAGTRSDGDAGGGSTDARSSTSTSTSTTPQGPSTTAGLGESNVPSTAGIGPFNSVGPLDQIQYEGYKGNMTEYCKQQENWLWRAYWQRECAVSAYYTALSAVFSGSRSYGPNGSAPRTAWSNAGQDAGGAPENGNAANRRPVGINNNNAGAWNMNIPRQMHGNPVVRRFVVRGIRTNNNTFAIDFNIAPIWKRFVAECIDFLILLIVKLFVTLTIIDNFDLIDLDNIDLDAVQEAGNLVDMALALTWELVILEFTHRIVVCFFEAYCLAKGGATPGKSFMGLRVLHCDQVIPLANNQNNLNPLAGGGLTPGSRVLVSPGSFLSFPRALARSLVKNFSLAFFFPLCFTLFHFEHNRTLYDLSSKSIVVEIRQQ